MRFSLTWFAFQLLLIACDGGSRYPDRVRGPVEEDAEVERLPQTPLVPVSSTPVAAARAKLQRTDSRVENDEGDALLGEYLCSLEAVGLPLGPFKLTPFGCRIFKEEDGALKLGRTSQGIASLQGDVGRPDPDGFHLTGVFKFPGNGLTIKTRMKRRPGAKGIYEGKGQGILNSGKEARKEFLLILTKN